MKKQINVRLSELGQQKLAELSQIYGSQTIAVEVALDRLHQQECAHKCQRCGKPLPSNISPYWVDGGESIFLCDECADPNGKEVIQVTHNVPNVAA